MIVEQDTYQGALNRLTRLGVNTIGIPLDSDGMRMDALAERSPTSKPRHHAEIHLYHSDRAEPDRHHHAGDARAELLEARRSNMACRSSRTIAMPT